METMAFFLLLFLGKESSVGFCKAGPFEDSTAYDETCGVPDTDCLLLETIWCGWRKKTHLLGKGIILPPLPILLCSMQTPKYNLQAPHAIVACITPRFLPNVFYYFSCQPHVPTFSCACCLPFPLRYRVLRTPFGWCEV